MPKNQAPSKIILRQLYQTMLTIRRFEEAVAQILSQQNPQNKQIKTPCHLYIGQEAVAVGVCAALKKTDYIFGTHRSHGCFIAKGGDLNLIAAEIYSRKTGCSSGKGGSMHLTAPEVGLLGTSAIVAGSIPLALGTALASKIKKDKRVSVAFFGDGATNEGVFAECLNLASLYHLPVIFVCENNLYCTHLPIDQCLAQTNISQRAKANKITSFRISGNDVIKVYQTTQQLISQLRRGQGPYFIEALAYRWLGHVGSSDDLDKGLRSRQEIDKWRKKCPIKKLEKLLFQQGLLSEAQNNRLIQQIDKKIEAAFNFAKTSPYPDKKDLLKDVFQKI